MSLALTLASPSLSRGAHAWKCMHITIEDQGDTAESGRDSVRKTVRNEAGGGSKLFDHRFFAIKSTHLSDRSETDSCTRNSSSCMPTCSVAH